MIDQPTFLSSWDVTHLAVWPSRFLSINCHRCCHKSALAPCSHCSCMPRSTGRQPQMMTTSLSQAARATTSTTAYNSALGTICVQPGNPHHKPQQIHVSLSQPGNTYSTPSCFRQRGVLAPGAIGVALAPWPWASRWTAYNMQPATIRWGVPGSHGCVG